MTVLPSPRPAEAPATTLCAACHARLTTHPLPEHCPSCGWRLDTPSALRQHVSACSDTTCSGKLRVGASWILSLAREGVVWACPKCGRQQMAQVRLSESQYLGFIETAPPEHAVDPPRD